MRNRSNLLVLLGIAFFVVGGIIVYVLTNDDESPSAASGGPVTVVVATQDIPAGSLADDIIAKGGLKETKVPAGQVQAGAVQSVQQLQGATFISGFADDTQVTTSGVQSLNRAFEVPEGFEAMAVQLDFVAGGAGYVNPGDRINLYGAYGPQYPIDGVVVPAASLLATNLEVIDVDLTIPARRGSADTAARGSSDSVTIMVAVRTSDAEKLVYTTEFQTLYATLLADGAPDSPDTPGRDGSNVLDLDPNAPTG